MPHYHTQPITQILSTSEMSLKYSTDQFVAVQNHIHSLALIGYWNVKEPRQPELKWHVQQGLPKCDFHPKTGLAQSWEYLHFMQNMLLLSRVGATVFVNSVGTACPSSWVQGGSSSLSTQWSSCLTPGRTVSSKLVTQCSIYLFTYWIICMCVYVLNSLPSQHFSKINICDLETCISFS